MSSQQVIKIVSGGQTGVDRVALDVAIFRDIPHGGWCPRGRRAEDGRIPQSYQLRETQSRDYAERTERNVIDSDGTLILHRNQMSKGTDLTRRLAVRHRRPLMCVELSETCDDAVRQQVIEVIKWLVDSNIAVLNVAGPRESTFRGIAQQAQEFLLQVFPEREE